MDKLEKKLRELAIYSKNDYKKVDVIGLLDGYELKPVSMGYNTRVFKIAGHDWVIKEGRWDLDLSLFGNTKVLLPAEPVEKLMNLFEMHYLPNKAEIIRQYELYLTFIEYFGYFDNQSSYYHPNRSVIYNKQKIIRQTLADHLEQMQKAYTFKINRNINKVLKSSVIKTNFLPKEYLLVGKSFSKKNEGKNTYYIFQEFIKGKLLHDIPNKKITKKISMQLALLIYLILLMRMQTGLLPDTRPRHMIQSYDWLTKTDNIIIGKRRTKFIDTRWLWDTNANFIKRGLIIPDIMIQQAKRYLNYYLKRLG